MLLSLTARAEEHPVTLEVAAMDNPAQAAVAVAVLKVAYSRLGLVLHTHTLPLRRGIQMADAGELDGDLIHTGISLNEWSHLILIRVPVARANLMAYKIGHDCPASISLDELIAGHAAYMRGTRGLEMLMPEQSLLASNNNWDALRAMHSGITRYAITGQLDSDIQIARRGIHDVCKVREPVLSMDLFHSLNERHADIAARLEQVLSTMDARGEIARIWAAQAKLQKGR